LNGTNGGGESRIGTHHFVKESRIAAAPGVVFAFHESPGALEKLTPPWEKVTVIESPGSLAPGTRAVLRTKVGPFAVEWVAEHTEYEPGRMFADRQVRGPFAYWYHRHWFLDDGQGGTLLRDEVDYRPPLGRVGEFLGARFLDSKLKKLFDYRHEATKFKFRRFRGGSRAARRVKFPPGESIVKRCWRPGCPAEVPLTLFG